MGFYFMREILFHKNFFVFRLDGKHVAINVVEDSIAHRAGLRNGDYILEVNDEAVCGLWENAVQMKMDMHSKRLDLLVVNDLSSFIQTRRNSFKFENNGSQNNDEDRSIVSSRFGSIKVFYSFENLYSVLICFIF